MRRVRPVQPKPLPANVREWLENIVAFRWGDGTLTRRDARVLLAGFLHLEQRLERLQRAGQQLSNAAFNLRQMGHLKPEERASLDEGWRQWDDAKKPQQPIQKRAAARRAR